MLLFMMFIGCMTFKQISCVSRFNYFETFSDISVVTRVKKSSDVPQSIKQVQFKVFNITFHLTLTAGTTVLATDFTAYTVNSYGNMTPFIVDTSTIYTGYLTDNSSIYVSAYTEESLWSLQIYGEENIYIIEPALYHLAPDSNPQNNTYIAYRTSDLKNITWKCLEKHPANINSSYNSNEQDYNFSKSRSTERNKRHLDGKTCLMNIVADYEFFALRCRNSQQICGSILVNIVQNADMIYRASVFSNHNGKTFVRIGLHIKNLLIYDSYTLASPLGSTKHVHFNVDGKLWTADEKLDSFSYFMTFMQPQLCLNHLFTSYSFPDQVLGLAFTDTLCKGTPSFREVINSALTSSMNSNQEQLSSFELLLAFSHEVGHNFGSPHDPDTPECNPSESQGGSFLMWSIGTSGKDPNNLRFSPCSLRRIGNQIAKVGCLVDTFDKSLCGNGLKEGDEQCDPGLSRAKNDPCCTRDCVLKSNAICSDKHNKCCSDCQLASNTTTCLDEEPWKCNHKSYCTGENFECPKPKPLPDYSPCLDGGMCYNGICMGYCDAKGLREKVKLKSCMCRIPEHACRLCCFNDSEPAGSKECKPHSSFYILDGRKCYFGQCKAGVCTSIRSSTLGGVVNYLVSLPKIGASIFLKSNLVLVIAILSSCVWIIVSIIASKLEQPDKDLDKNLRIKKCMPVKLSELMESKLRAESTSTILSNNDFLTPPESQTEINMPKTPVPVTSARK